MASINSSPFCSSRVSVTPSSSSSSSVQYTNSLPPVIPVALEQITQLNNPRQETVSFSTDPKIFFGHFGVNTCLFTSQDVHLLRSLFKKTKLHPSICLIDLLGLQFYRLLKELTVSWADEDQKKIQKEWAKIYLMGYLGLLRQSVEHKIPKSEVTQDFQLAPGGYMRDLRTFTKNFAEQIAPKASETIQLLKPETKSLWEEWNALQKFLEKCLVQKDSYKILSTEGPASCSGGEEMIPTSEDEVFQAIKNLHLYLEIMVVAEEACLEKKLIELEHSYLKEFLNEIDSFIHLKTSKEISDQSKKLLGSITKMIWELQKKVKVPQKAVQDAQQELSQDSRYRSHKMNAQKIKTSERFLESSLQICNLLTLESCCLSDYQKILEESIIHQLDPLFYISRAYEERARLNFEAIYELLSSETSFFFSIFSRDLTITEHLQNIKSNFFISLRTKLSTIEYLRDWLGANYGGLFLKNERITFLIIYLERFAYEALDNICDLNLQNDDKQSLSPPLLERLLWLGRIFVLIHDLAVLSKPESKYSELEIFPDKFLQLLALEDPIDLAMSLMKSRLETKLDAEMPPEPPSLQPLEISLPNSGNLENELFSLRPVQQMPLEAGPIELENVAIKSVAQTKSIGTLPQAPSKTSKKKEKKQSAPPLPPKLKSSSKGPAEKIHSSVHPQGVTPKDLMQTKKRQDVETILKALGLTPIRTKGAHVIWENPNDARIHTVVPRHDEIKKGTRSAMVKQISPQD